MDIKSFQPDFLFEISWEICNKVGGIYTVLATKSEYLSKVFGDTHIYIGPDVWMETTNTPDFKEDDSLYKSWADTAHADGLSFRIGRWLVHGNPVVILVDFRKYFSERNKIFADYWEKYRLDSISGQWDYIEPVMFGYAAAKIIESFYSYNVSASDNIEAQFHEWMSGMGIIYLKDTLPQISTIFTTHATMIGRCIAGNGMMLYKDLNKIDPEDIANRFNIRAKYSVEKLSVSLCDVFTTVSELTSREAEVFYGRAADIVQPNGFIREFAQTIDDCNRMRSVSRRTILNVAGAMFDVAFEENTPVLITSGRYEFRNKGFDLLIDALSVLNKSDLKSDVIALFCVPSNVITPVKALQEKIAGKQNIVADKYLTHYIHNPESDEILKDFRSKGLDNSAKSKVKVIFVPVYLNGDDGIFNISYYDVLAGTDLSVFASYYEPYGYTPLESIAFGVPTITSSLSGFGKFVDSITNSPDDGIWVLNRNDENYDDTVCNLVSIIQHLLAADNIRKEKLRNNAFNLSEEFLWNKLIDRYFEAYSSAHSLSRQREGLYKDKKMDIRIKMKSIAISSNPTWRKVFVKQSLPDILQPLRELSMNLWWSWNKTAENLFISISPSSWEDCEHNPVTLLESLTDKDLIRLQNDDEFRKNLESVYAEFNEYMSLAEKRIKPSIAYFSMEYGIHNSLKIFSGGLGMLAGDYLKEMSDSNIDAVGIGLLYRYGYFKQSLSPAGNQIATDIPQRFTHLPIVPVRDEEGKWLEVKIALPARNMTAQIWKVNVGRIPLYLLDTDVDTNWEIDRSVTYHLYGGDWENRLKQELLLGIGGVRLLRQLHLDPTIYHLNEGHAAFAGLERLREFVDIKRYLLDEAIEIVRSSTLFTTHTPVPAGHDAFDEDLLRTYLPHYPDLLNCTWERMVNLGKFHPNSGDKFSMSVFAINTSQEVNGVSKVHGQVTREMFLDLFKGYYVSELYIDYVTNGVHYPTWVAEQWHDLHVKYFGKEFLDNQMNPKYWSNIYKVPDEEIWRLRQNLRKSLIDTLKQRLPLEMTNRQESPKNILVTTETLSDKKLTIGFARRFATYKRAHLLFQNPERLNKIINSSSCPVQFIFAGKAHPADKAGQDLIRNIIEFSRRPEFIGKIVFVENYDMEIAKKLVQGVDIWLNTPTRPLEASGTSGEKALMNGVLNLSVLDGWWVEGYKEGAGWALSQKKTYKDQGYQDILDSETIYNLLENEISHLFYTRNSQGVPEDWVKYIKNSFAWIAPHFTMKRMLSDYQNKFYNKLSDKIEKFSSNNYELAAKYASWKRKITNAWDDIEVTSVSFPDPNNNVYKVGDTFEMSIELKINELNVNDVVVELVIGRRDKDFNSDYLRIIQMTPGEKVGSKVVFSISDVIHSPGVVDVAVRVHPYNSLMPYYMDVKSMKWI